MAMNTVFISPHDDDQVLFGAFTLLREQPIVMIVFDGHVQRKRGLPVTPEERWAETLEACDILGPLAVVRLGFRDDDPTITEDRIRSRAGEVISRLAGKRLYVPAFENGGHSQHNLVASAFASHSSVLARYVTYTREPAAKTTTSREVPILEPHWIGLKLRALACFQSQFLPAAGCQEHFIGRSLREYYL